MQSRTKMKAQDALRKRIFELADQKSYSINKIASNCYINTSTITSLLNGHSKKSEIATISKICYGLGVSLREFFDSPIFDNVNDVEE